MKIQLTCLYVCLSVVAVAGAKYDYYDDDDDNPTTANVIDTNTTLNPQDVIDRYTSSSPRETDGTSWFREVYEYQNRDALYRLDSWIQDVREKFTALKQYQRLRHFYVSQLSDGKRYLASRTLMPFTLDWANSICRMENGYLLQLDSQVEFDFVVRFLQEETDFFSIRTGVNDVKLEGHYVNYNSGEVFNVSAFPWYRANPHSDEDCVEIQIRFEQLRYLHCTLSTTPFICEVPAEQSLL